ncbi:hypothetical protein ACGFLS_10390 [Streptomyces abikoensis]|uniref:hypothetical protein n=1 Tax=Streptomyces abikoensis TaxID=97398 RepID=UPI00371BBABA
MKNNSRPLPAWKKLLFVGSTLTLLGGSLNLAWNTNVLGPDSLCRDVASAAQIQRTFGHTGRLVDTNATEIPRRDSSPQEFRCTVKQTTKLLGREEGHLRLEGSQDPPGYRFPSLNTGRSTETSFFSGRSTGAVSDYTGWIILPESCWKGSAKESGAYVVEASATGGELKRIELARLLVDAANHVSRRAGCAARALTAPAELQAPAKPQHTDFTKVCGIDGFSVPPIKSSRQGTPRETTRPLTDPIWTCDLFLDDSRGPYASFTVARDRLLVSAARKKSHGSVNNELVTSCAGNDTYFAMNGSAQYRRMAGRTDGAALPDERALFVSFVKAAGKSLGCGSITP